MKRSFSNLMENYRILIWNAEDPAIKVKIEPFGYTSEKLEEGKSLYQEVEILAEIQRKEYAEQYTVSSQFIEKRHEAELKLNELRKFAKFAFKKLPEAIKTLHLATSVPDAFPAWLEYAKYFFERLQEHPEWITALAPFGITVENITANLAALTELKSLQEERQRETGDSQQATLARNAKFEELKNWYNELRDLAKILFEDEDAQYLEKLGILVRS